MKIVNNTTSKKQDNILKEQLDYIGLKDKQLEEIVNIIFRLYYIPIDIVLDILWIKNITFIRYDDINIIKNWIDKCSNMEVIKKVS